MSIYDDLANSAYMNNQNFRQQFQFDQNNLEDSMNGSRQFIDFNNDIDSGKANQFDQFLSNRDSLPNGKYMAEKTPDHYQPYSQNDQPSQNYSQLNQLLQMTSEVKGNKIGSNLPPNSRILQNHRNQKERDEVHFDDDEGEGTYIHQQIYSDKVNLHQQQFQNQQQPQYQIQNKQIPNLNLVPQNLNQMTPISQNQSQQEINLNQFKNQNEQLQLLLQQLQTPQFTQFPPQPPSYAQSNMFSSQAPYSYQQKLPIQTPNKPQPNFNGPSHRELNQDNSLLAIAQRRDANPSTVTSGEHPHDMSQDHDFGFKDSYSNNFYTNNSLMKQNMYTPSENHFGNPNISGMQSQIQQQYLPQRNQERFEKENADQNILLQQNIQQQQFEQQKQNQMKAGPTHFYNRQISGQEQKKKEIMEHFDDIPIKDLNKLNKDEEVADLPTEEPLSEQERAIEERLEDPQWKVRMTAYKEIGELFYKAYQKDCDQKKQKGSNINQNEEEEDQNPFDYYGVKMQMIISDTNLIAQYEALSCLFTYMRLAPDIKEITFQVHGILFDKVQLNKPNFREITMKILLCIIKRDRSQTIIPSLLKRFKSKNTKVSAFAMQVMTESLSTQAMYDQQLLRQVYNSLQDSLANSNKEIRDTSIALLKMVYSLCEDDSQVFIKNIKQQLRPVQVKELKDMLSQVDKITTAELIHLFPNSCSQVEPSMPAQNKQKPKDAFLEDDFEEGNKRGEVVESDLSLLVPVNFFEIPYLSQINVKKKGMESFNIEMEKLVSKGEQALIANKDYSNIFNVITHLLEDSNVLVFSEAIKAVEYLTLLLGKNMKPAKLKHFIQLLTEKYKESKSAVVTQINKAISTIIQAECFQLGQLIEYLVLTLAFPNKNPRVKQMILEKIDQILQSEEVSDDELTSVFKNIKEKLIQFIQKDTNAGVRDAAVAVLINFKRMLPSEAIVIETVNALPKYRVTEINKKAIEGQVPQQKQSNTNLKEQIGLQKQISQKQTEHSKEGRTGSASQTQQSGIDFSYQGRSISGQYQIHIADIVLSLKKMVGGKLQINQSVLKQKWEESIEKLGEIGVKEGKPVIISCVFWVFTNYLGAFVDQGLNSYLEPIAYLVKTLYCIERSVEVSEDNRSLELTQVLSISNALFLLSQNKKQSESIYNIMFSASGSIAQTFLTSLCDVLIRLPKLSSNSPIEGVNDQIGLAKVIEFMFGWAGEKVTVMMQKGIQVHQFEELRSLALTQLEKIQKLIESNYSDELEEAKDVIIQTMVRFKERVLAGNKAIYAEEEEDEGAEEKQEEQEQIQVKAARSQTEETIEMIEKDFERGMQMIKPLSLTSELQDCSNKQALAQKLLSIVQTQSKHQQQQYHQAYALKALLWLKAEVFGLEDCFKLAPLIFEAYSKSQGVSSDEEDSGKDSSVELYLLNNWTKELSLRDIIDRISQTTKSSEQQSQKSGNLVFQILFKWVMNQRLQAAAEDDKWNIEDFRKVCINLAQNIKQIEVRDFIQQCVDKFGIKKVREFMEIQLMHAQNDYNNFIDWFNIKYRHQQDQRVEEQEDQIKGKLASLNIQDVEQPNTKQRGKKPMLEDAELTQVLSGSDSQMQNYDSNPSMPTSARNNHHLNTQAISSYQQIRQKRKTSNQKKQSYQSGHDESMVEQSSNKYETILQRLEEQLHNNGPIKNIKSGQISNKSKEYEEQVRDERQELGAPQINSYQSRAMTNKSDKRLRYEEQKIEDSSEKLEEELSIEQLKDSSLNEQYKQPWGKQLDYNKQVQLLNENPYKSTSIDQKKMQEVLFSNETSNYEAAEERLMQSQVKQDKYREEMENLNLQRLKIEEERVLLMKEKNKETQEWKSKYDRIREEHEDVVESLKEANTCYLVQVNENEELKKQLRVMQEQHVQMMKRFEDIEKRIQQKEEVKQLIDSSRPKSSISQFEDSLQVSASPKTKRSKQQNVSIAKEESLQKITAVFQNRQNSQIINKMATDGEYCIKKVQELLLSTETKENNEELGTSLFIYYARIKRFAEKIEMIKTMNSSLDNQDILYALSIDTYVVLLNFLLKVFAVEKANIERDSLEASLGKQGANEQNEITIESQKIVSKLLNSKEFTTSLVALFQILKTSLPEDMSLELSDVDQQFLRVLMRCISRITKALHSENPDMIRAFDVLIEMQKIFAVHPPENLREDMPSLQDFDYVYRTLKDVSDKFMELQPEKVKGFLDFVTSDNLGEKSVLRKQNAFIMYMKQVMRSKYERDDEEEEGDGGNGGGEYYEDEEYNEE